MTWYMDLVAILLMAVAGIGYMHAYYSWLMRSTPLTKDGYKVRFNRLMKLEGEWRLGNKFKEQNLNLRALQEETSSFDSSMILKMLVYYSLTSLVIWVTDWSIYAVALTAGYWIVTLGLAHIEMRKNYKMALVHISQLPITAPAEFQQYGRYAWNPFDLKSALEQLYSLRIQERNLQKSAEETKHRISQVSNDQVLFDLEENLPSNLRGVDKVSHHILLDLEEGLSCLLQDVDNVTRHIQGLTTCIQEELLTNDDSLIAKSGNETKQRQPNVVTPPESSETEEPIDSKLPYHIEEMKGIASNPNLPRDVVERAEKLVKKHDEQEVERKRQAEIDEALVSIKTVENFYEKNEEMRVRK